MAAGFKQATVRAADVPATQTDIPSYVDLARLGITTLAEAESVRVYADAAKVTEWAREIVSLTEMHVKVPSLTSTVTMYVDWDGVRADYAVGATYGRNNVWTAYRAVFHLDDLVDSTGNGYTLANNNSVTMNATGKLGGSADFTSGNTNKTLTSATDLGMSLTSYTVDMWLRLYNVTAFGQGPWIINDATTRRVYGYFENSGGASMRFAHEGSASTQFNAVSAWTNDVWRKYTHTWDNTTQRGYMDGVSGGSNTPTGNTSIVNSTFRLGAHQADVAPSLYWKGRIDEARVTDSTRGANWITTEYNNQNDEATFWGTWSDVGGGGPSVFDTVTVTESITLERVFLVNIFDTVTIAEVVTLATSFPVDTFDTVTIAEAVTLEQVFVVDTFDTVTVTESITLERVFEVNTFDTVTVTESITVEQVFVVDIFDTIGISEVATLEVNHFVVAFDSITITESVAASQEALLEVNGLDTLTISETTTTELSNFVNVFDAVGISEAIQTETISQVNVFDLVSVEEDTISGIALGTDVFDSVTITESIITALSSEITVVDTLSIFDVIISNDIREAEVNDTLTLVEVVSVTPQLFLEVFSSLVLGEILEIQQFRVVNVFDSIAITEEATNEIYRFSAQLPRDRYRGQVSRFDIKNAGSI